MPDDPRAAWVALIETYGLQPDLRVSAAERPGVWMAGVVGGCAVRLRIDPAPRRTVWLRVCPKGQEKVMMGQVPFRLHPRAELPGWVGPGTGDADFDAVVAVLPEDLEATRLLLDTVTRAATRAVVEVGGWCDGFYVHLGPAATARAADAEQAAELVERCVRACRRLARPVPGVDDLLVLSLDDPAAEVAGTARRRLLEGRREAELLAAVRRHPGADPLPWLQAVEPRDASTMAAWLALAGHSDAAWVDARLVAMWEGGPPRGAEAALVDAALERYAALRAEGAPTERWAPLDALMRGDFAATRAAVVKIAAGDRGPLADWLASLRFPDDGEVAIDVVQPRLQLEVCEALGAAGHPAAAERWLRLTVGVEERVEGSSGARLPAPPARVVAALGGLPTDAAEALLTRWVGHLVPLDDIAVRQLAAFVAPRVGDDPPPAWLETALATWPEPTWRPLLGALTSAPTARAVPALVGLAERLPVLHDEVVRLLTDLGTPAAEPWLLRALKVEDAEARRRVIAALATCGTLGSLPALRELDGFFAEFFAERTVKEAARAAVEAIEARGWPARTGWLSPAEGGGGLSLT